jgi:hypothetical protein
MYCSHDLSPRLTTSLGTCRIQEMFKVFFDVSIVLAKLNSKRAFSAHPVNVLPDFYPVDQVLKSIPDMIKVLSRITYVSTICIGGKLVAFRT